MVKDVTRRERSVQAPSGMRTDLFDYDAGSDFGAFEIWGVEAEENSVIINSDWMRVDVASSESLDFFPGEDHARKNAERDVQISADAYLMGLGRVAPGRQEQDRVVSELQAAIDEFSRLLDTDPEEWKIQLYLGIRRNQMLLEPSKLDIRSEVPIGRWQMDLVVELPPGERYILIEIERPRHKLFTRKDRITKEVVHAQQQVEDWMNRIKEHPHEAREILPGIKEPQGWVVIGRRNSMTEGQQRVLERKNARVQNITVMTYDDLLDKARQHLDNLRDL